MAGFKQYGLELRKKNVSTPSSPNHVIIGFSPSEELILKSTTDEKIIVTDTLLASISAQLQSEIDSISGSGGGFQDTFETVNSNLKAYTGVLNYTGEDLTSIDYNTGSGTITKTLTYNISSGNLTDIILSGDTPAGIDLVKTLSYNISGDLTGFTYS